MENVSYVVLSHQMALERQLEVLANNVANMSSTAFRGERPLFEEFLTTAEDGTTTSYVENVGLLRNTTEGAHRSTGNPYDVALSGNGYFVVDTEDGQRFTRNGNWRLDQDGQIVTQLGNPVVDEDGLPIVVDSSDGPITIRADGAVLTNSGLIGKLNIVTFDDEQIMPKLGDGLYGTGGQVAQPTTDISVLQGMLESSNVNGVVEMTLMMDVANAYRTTAQMTSANDDLRRRAIQTIGRVLSV